jgi:hypothetical protein
LDDRYVVLFVDKPLPVTEDAHKTGGEPLTEITVDGYPRDIPSASRRGGFGELLSVGELVRTTIGERD